MAQKCDFCGGKLENFSYDKKVCSGCKEEYHWNHYWEEFLSARSFTFPERDLLIDLAARGIYPDWLVQ